MTNWEDYTDGAQKSDPESDPESDPGERLAWLAWGYVAEELDEEAREAFELRLAGDQEARDALAEAVELTQAVLAVSAEPVADVALSPPAPRSGRWQPLAWGVLGAAACWGMIVLAQAVFQTETRPLEVAEQDRVQASLAMAWVDAREELADAEGEFDGLFERDVVPLQEVKEQVVGDVESPDWMVSALIGLREAETVTDDEGAIEPRRDRRTEES